MERIRTIKNTNYTVISNVFLKDINLSLKAKGLMAYIMSLPDSWDFSISGILTQVKEGKTAIYGAIDELITFGYCQRKTIYNKNLIQGVEYVFFEAPNFEPFDSDFRHPENLNTENLNTENQPQLNTNINKVKNKVNKDKNLSNDKTSFSLKQKKEKKNPPPPTPAPFAEARENFKEWFCKEWYKNNHEGGFEYQFKKGRDGQHLKDIFTTIEKMLRERNIEPTNENIFEYLKRILENFDKKDFAWINDFSLGVVYSQFVPLARSAKKVIDAKKKQAAMVAPQNKPLSEDELREAIFRDKSLTPAQREEKLNQLNTIKA